MNDENYNELPDDLQIEDEPVSFTNVTHDPTLVVAKGRFYGSFQDRLHAQSEHISKLYHVILKVLSKHGQVKIRAMGSFAVSNAVKAIERATATCEQDSEITLYWKVWREKGNLGELRNKDHVEDVDAYVFCVGSFEKENKNDE